MMMSLVRELLMLARWSDPFLQYQTSFFVLFSFAVPEWRWQQTQNVHTAELIVTIVSALVRAFVVCKTRTERDCDFLYILGRVDPGICPREDIVHSSCS